ncbi:MAG: M23 family metallopeptidase [Planctomycetes bacterium]|nr:M23 family metallopeptidase [Planctomycetota bacterium]
MATEDISVEELSAKIGIPVHILDRAIENGLLLPRNNRQPFVFTREEIALISDWAAVPKLLSRIRRDGNGEYVGRYIGPDDYGQKNRYILPFEGCWLVTDGGKLRTAKGRMRSFDYYMAPCVRWAWDFCAIHPDDYGKCHVGMPIIEMLRLRFRRGQEPNIPDYDHSEPGDEHEFRKILNPEALDNKRHYLYEVDLVAPARGVIMTRKSLLDDPSFVERIEFLRDRGEDDDHEGFMIKHDNDEYSQFAHVLGRTIAVRPGQQVEQGEFLCKAGGKHCFMPHLHWAVWDNWHPILAQGLPIRISNCMAYRENQFVAENNVWLERGMLVKNS